MMLVNKLSRDAYDIAMGQLILPDNVIATKKSSASKKWQRGASRDASHDVWWISDRNPNLIERTKLIIRFDSPIAPGDISLADESFLSQALTKRIYAVHGLEFGIRDEAIGCHTIAKHCEKLDWIYRWMWSEDRHGFHSIDETHYNEFLDRLSHGVANLVPLSDRIRHHVETSYKEFEPLYWLNSRGKHSQIDWSHLARELGVTTRSLDDHSFRLNLVDEISSTFSLKKDDLEFAFAHTSANRKPVSVSSFENWLGVWDDIYRMSASGLLSHDALSFNPFAFATLKQTASDLGEKRKPTPTLPPEFLLALMDKAVPWVFDYSAWIIRAIEETKKLDDVQVKKRPEARVELAERLNRGRPPGAPKIWPSWRTDYRYSDCFILSDMIQFLLLSCAILISSFGARRLNETLGIKQGCISETRRGVFELSIYIEKTLQSVDKIPVPAMISGVVDVLEEVTRSSRAFTGNDWLFEVVRKDGLGDTYQRSSNLNRTFAKFTQFHGLSAPAGLDDWQLASHQLRRGFAISYYYGFEIADLDALSWFMRHFDPEMTRIYVKNILPGQISRLEREMTERRYQMRVSLTEEDRKWFHDQEKMLRDLRDRGQLWEAERQGAIAYRLLKLFNVSDSVAGRGAEKLDKNLTELVARATARVRVGGRSNNPAAFDNALVDEFMRFGATNYLEPVPGGHSLCSFGPEDEDMSDAACLQLQKLFKQTQFGNIDSSQAEGPDFRFSGLHPCIKCRYCVKMNKNVAKSHQLLEEVEAGVATAATAALRDRNQDILNDLIRMSAEAGIDTSRKSK